jgi:long-chain acyl-CoA synthetase
VRVRRAIVRPEPWTVENGLLTPPLKVKRNDVLKRFAPEIEAVYAGGAAAD